MLPRPSSSASPPIARHPLLTKGCYGFEHDRTKTPFGLLNEQQCTDHVVKSGGWFNYRGEKIGRGDLSLADLARISREIPTGEMFIVVPESESLWDMPKAYDRSHPPRHYLWQTASWCVSRDTGMVRVRDDIHLSDIRQSGGGKTAVSYRRVARGVFVETMLTTNGSAGPQIGRGDIEKALEAARQLLGQQTIGSSPLGRAQNTKPASVP